MFYVFSIYCVVPKFRIKYFHLIYFYLYMFVRLHGYVETHVSCILYL